MSSARDLTGALDRIVQDPATAGASRDELFQGLYDELLEIARAYMSRERAGHSLHPTALVHEAYLALVRDGATSWEGRAHFFGVAARAMRQVLIHHARRRGAAKRGGGARRVTLGTDLVPGGGDEFEVLAIHDALDRLAEQDERGARVSELRIFAGLTHKEIAYLLDVSIRTVEGDWAYARKWLARELLEEPSA